MSQNVCNICGANYEYHNGRWKCPACGAFKAEELSNEEVTLLYNAAQKLRLSDFDEAEKAYADIIEKFPKNPDGYWGRLLSRYGIKYEEDFDGRKIPTCYATSIESVITDKDYLKATELADQETRAYYNLQAQYIERVRKEWVEKARKEKPYDIFICYKDSDLANGIDRTQDSIAAQELYIHLTEQGYRVFFSRESLRGKVGEKYEPYIFNALSTAKVMLVYGSKSEYITSTWLKNEWTRYEKRFQAGEKKPNSLIVACDGFSPNELPKVLSSTQCFDATSRSFYTDLDATLKKIIKGEEKPKPVAEPKPEKKKSKKLPIAIASIAALIAIFLCILLPNVLGNKPSATIADSKYGVVISADSEIFDKNTSVIVDKLTDGAQYTSLVSTVNNSKSVEIKNAVIYDIECDADITKNVTIKVAYSKSDANLTVKVYYVSDDKSLIEEHSCIYDEGFVEFKTNHLSYYVIGEIEQGNSNPSTIIERVGMRTITLSDKFTAEYILAKWEGGSKSEASIIEIMDEYGAQQGGGQLYIITPGEFIEEVDEWCFTSERKVGDYAIIENAYGFSLCYISSINPVQNPSDNTGDNEKLKATINFDSNGGSGSMLVQSITVGGSANLTTCSFTKSGYTFSGWATTASGSVVYTDGASFNAESESEIMLYAIWVPNSNSLVFNSNGGSGSMDTISIETNEIITLPLNSFTKSGYTFLGWSDSQNGSVQYTDRQSFEMTSSATVTLYAVWSANTNTINFDANGGTGYMSAQQAKTDEKVTLKQNSLSRKGYTFKGWSTSSNGAIVYSDKAEYIVETGPSITLYAVWDEISYSINYIMNGGTANSNPSSYTIETSTFSLAVPTQKGYKFLGWTGTDLEGYTKEVTIIRGSTGDKTYTANWELIQDRTLMFSSNGGSGTMQKISVGEGQVLTLPENLFYRSGYRFVGWGTSADGKVVYGDQTEYTVGSDEMYVLYAIWKYGEYSDGLIFSSFGEAYYVSGYDGTDVDIIIPNSYNEKPVTSIGYHAFENCDNIQSVKFPETLTSIKGGAFEYCDYLESIVIPNSVTSIDVSAFHGCTRLKTVILSENLKYIGDAAFSECYYLENIEIPMSCTRLGASAFQNCSALKEIILNKEITIIEEKVFEGCSNLVIYCDAETKPSGWDERWNYSSCKVIWGYGSYTLGLVFELKNDDTYAVVGYEGTECNVIIPSTYNGIPVTKIAKSAFYNCTILKEITIPSSVTDIDNASFNGCSSLEIMNIPTVGRFVDFIENTGEKGFYRFGYIFGTEEYDNAFCYKQDWIYFPYGYNYDMIYGGITQNYYIPESLKKIVIGEVETPINTFEIEGVEVVWKDEQ